MVFIKWGPALKLGIEIIDEQHKTFVGIVNDAYVSLEKNEDPVIIEKILSQLVDFVRYHFATEEKYFLMFNYELTEEHIKEHNSITLKVLNFYNKIKSEKKVLSKDILEFLKSWLEDHLKTMDRKYVDCFHTNGLK